MGLYTYMEHFLAHIHWEQDGLQRQAIWYSEAQPLPPSQVMFVDDTITANKAIELARDGVGLIWSGDYQNARELLKAILRRLDRKPRVGSQKAPTGPTEIFVQHRSQLGIKAQITEHILIMLSKDFAIKLRRGQDVQEACQEVIGLINEPIVMPLKVLLALVSAHEWRKKKIRVKHLSQPITPYFGVFSPVRGEYLDLIVQMTNSKFQKMAFDIGVGTGVLSILLTQKGYQQIIGTDIEPRAIACAQENIKNHGLEDRISVIQADIFPQGRADLIVCNPPWIPAIPSSPIEWAIFDPESQFLKKFLAGLKDHLQEDGQAWLIISDIAEHLQLRSREELMTWIKDAGLKLEKKVDVVPKHPKIQDTEDTLHFAREKELTSLWVLKQD